MIYFGGLVFINIYLKVPLMRSLILSSEQHSVLLRQRQPFESRICDQKYYETREDRDGHSKQVVELHDGR